MQPARFFVMHGLQVLNGLCWRVQEGPTMYEKARDTAVGAATAAQQGAYNLKDRVIGPSTGTGTGTGYSSGTHTGTGTGYSSGTGTGTGTGTGYSTTGHTVRFWWPAIVNVACATSCCLKSSLNVSMARTEGASAARAGGQAGRHALRSAQALISLCWHAQEGPTMYEKARDTAVGAAAAAGAGAQNLKDRVMGTGTSTQPVRPQSAVCPAPGPAACAQRPPLV